MSRYWSSAYFDREYNAWAVGRHDTSRAGRAESMSTYPDEATAKRVAREENAKEERHDRARRTIKHNETTQALKDAAEFKERFPNQPYSYNWFVVRFNTAIAQAQGRWEWKVYEEAAKAALSGAKPKRARTRKKPQLT